MSSEPDELNAALARLQRLGASRRVFARVASAAGSELGQQAVAVLRALPQAGSVSVVDAAHAAQMDVGAVSRQLRALGDAGLIERRTNPDNGSVVLVELTSAGRDARRRFDDVRSQHLARALAGWSAADRTELGRLLTRLVDDFMATTYEQVTAADVGRS